MELNTVNKKANENKIINPEGSIVLDRPKEIQLYLESSGLNIKSDSFYETAEGKLKSVIDMAKDSDDKFVLGLAKFLADKGLKLSPVVLLSILSSKKYSFKGSNVNYIFNTPARIAEAMAMNKHSKLNNSFKKHVLKVALENMNDITLKKNKMRNRKIKLKDLIKYLRPHPKDKSLALLYKAIIENDNSVAGLKSSSNFLALKSASVKTEDEEAKKEDLAKMVLTGKVPINQLIRNLKYLAEQYDFKKQKELELAVLKTLSEFKNYRILNMFDVIQAAIYVPHFEKALFEVIKNYVEEIRAEFKYDKETTFLFDVSGSMHGDGEKNGFRYLALLSLLFEDSQLRFFSDHLFPSSDEGKRILRDLKVGAYKSAKAEFDDYIAKHSGGTALLESLEKLINENSSPHIVVISDEVSWEEGSDLTPYINRVNQFLKGRRLTLINPQVYKGTVFYNNVVGIASLTSTILFDIAMMNDPKGFIEHIRNYRTSEGQVRVKGGKVTDGRRKTKKARPKAKGIKKEKRKN